MNDLNLFEKSDKRKTTNINDSLNNDGKKFAFFSFHISSVGVTLGTIVALVVIIVLFRNLNLKCLRSAWRGACNCKEPGPSRPRPDPYGRASEPVAIIPHVSRMPVVSSNRTSQLYPELEQFSYQPMTEVYQGVPGQYPISNVPSAPVGKSTGETSSNSCETAGRVSIKDNQPIKTKSFAELQMEQLAKLEQAKI